MKHPCVTCLRLRARSDNKTAEDTIRICNECMKKDKDKGLNDEYFKGSKYAECLALPECSNYTDCLYNGGLVLGCGDEYKKQVRRCPLK